MFSSTMNKEGIAYTKPRRSKQIAKGGYREMLQEEEYLEEDEITDYSQASDDDENENEEDEVDSNQNNKKGRSVTEDWIAKVLHFATRQQSGQRLIKIVCSRYKLPFDGTLESIDQNLWEQVAHAVLFNPALPKTESGISQCIRDVQGVTCFRLEFLENKKSIVRGAKISAELGKSDQLEVVLRACSHCGSVFSGRFQEATSSHVRSGGWKEVTEKIHAGAHSWTDIVGWRLCVPCFSNWSTKGTFVNNKRMSIQQVINKCPKDFVLVSFKGYLSDPSQDPKESTNIGDVSQQRRTVRAVFGGVKSSRANESSGQTPNAHHNRDSASSASPEDQDYLELPTKRVLVLKSLTTARSSMRQKPGHSAEDSRQIAGSTSTNVSNVCITSHGSWGSLLRATAAEQSNLEDQPSSIGSSANAVAQEKLVEVFADGEWWNAVITEERGTQVHVHFEGGLEDENEWLHRSSRRIRPRQKSPVSLSSRTSHSNEDDQHQDGKRQKTSLQSEAHAGADRPVISSSSALAADFKRPMSTMAEQSDHAEVCNGGQESCEREGRSRRVAVNHSNAPTLVKVDGPKWFEDGIRIGLLRSDIELSVECEGEDLTFQWLCDGKKNPGENGRSMSVSHGIARDSKRHFYSCLVSNEFGSVISSVPVRLPTSLERAREACDPSLNKRFHLTCACGLEREGCAKDLCSPCEQCGNAAMGTLHPRPSSTV